MSLHILRAMAAMGEEQQPPTGDPYVWESTGKEMAPEVKKLWNEVAQGIDKSQTGTSRVARVILSCWHCC